MNNFRGKYEQIHEDTLYRFQQGGFLAGDYVAIKKDALQSEMVDKLTNTTKEMLKALIKQQIPLRISYIKSATSEAMSGPVGAANVPGCLWADVVIEYAPGMWKNPMTLPLAVLEKLTPENEAEGYRPYSKELKRKNRNDSSEASPDKFRDEQTKGKDKERQLTTKNTKLAHTKDPRDGREGLKVKESNEKIRTNEYELIAEAYGQVSVLEALQSKLVDFYNNISGSYQTISSDELFKLITDTVSGLEIKPSSKNIIIQNATKIYKLGKARGIPDGKINFEFIKYLGNSINKFETMR